MEQISSSDLEITKLKPHDDLNSFECGNEDLNEFIRCDALNQMNASINVTYLVRYHGEIVAFFTLSADSIRINTGDLVKFQEKEIFYTQFPALKIGRLAVSRNYHSMGIGSTLIFICLGVAYELSSKVGIRFLSLDVYSHSIDFYKKKYFTEFNHTKRKRTCPMYLDIFRLL